jgi:hypothetical protein
LSTKEALTHAMRSVLTTQLQEFDMIETAILSYSGRIGLEFSELEPTGRYLYRFRLSHRFHRTDSDLSERIILYFTKDQIFIQKLLHQIDSHDPTLNIIAQKYLDRKAITILQLQSFL